MISICFIVSNLIDYENWDMNVFLLLGNVYLVFSYIL